MVDELTTNDETGHAVDFTVQALFCAFSKKTQGHPKKTQGPFLGKKLNLSEAISDFTKKLKKFHTQITVFHGGHTFYVIFINKFLIFRQKKCDFNGFLLHSQIFFGESFDFSK